MNWLKSIKILLLVALLAWAIEAIYLLQQNVSTPNRIQAAETKRRSHLTLTYQKNIRALEKEYAEKKYLATGKTVFDRIYNTQNQSIVDLIQRISNEALPESWSSDVKVEEFTHFILLIYLPHNAKQVRPTQAVSYLRSILKNCGWLLSDVAVFDRTHKSYLFFDKPILTKIKKGHKISQVLLRRAKEHGKLFTKFNSVTIECKKHESHLFLPLEITGPKGVVSCYGLLDTGASTTTLTDEVVSKTGFDNLQNAHRRNFNTANGLMSCPIVTREVNVGGFRKGIEVAVNQRDEMNLLGVNFFEGMAYIVDFQNSAIYIWGE